MDIQLRPARLSDLELIDYWDHKPHVLEAIGEDEYEYDDWMEKQLKNPSDYVWLYIAELDGRPIGLIQIVDPANEETHYWGEIDEGYRAMDIWIGEEDDLGKGYGSKMMKLALEKCFEEDNVNAVLVDPLLENKKAHNFYIKNGFEFLRNQEFEDDECAVFIYNRNLNKPDQN